MTACEPLCALFGGGVGKHLLPTAWGPFWAAVRKFLKGTLGPSDGPAEDERKSSRLWICQGIKIRLYE